MASVVRPLFALCTLTSLLGCAGFPLQIEQIPVSEDPSQQISRLGEAVEKAREGDVDVLAPSWFARAEESLGEALEVRSEGGAVQEVLTHVARGLAEIDRAEQLAGVSRATIPRAIEARAGARAAGAPSSVPAYSGAEQAFLELTAAIENDDTSWAQNRQEQVMQRFRDLELQAIKDNTLREVRELIKAARSGGAGELTPRTLAAAESELRGVEAFITQNRYERARATELAAKALFEAQRLTHTLAEARRLRKLNPEEISLAEEKLFSTVGEALGLPDFRNRSFDTRRDALIQGAGELANDRNFLVNRNELTRSELESALARIAALEGETEAERQRIARLEAERRFNQLYSEVSSYFDSDEAEVYKQGQQLVIRLRKVAFPIGEHVLQPDSYSLLTKVQRAIRVFGAPRVIVEGHTDTTGSAELNDHLSQLRASAVREYLVANHTVPPEAVVAVGRGFREPLASNRTAEGRAQNRRIDVMIDATHRDGAELPPVSAPPPGD